MRRFFFRFSAILLGVAFIGAISVGALNNMPLLQRVISFGLGIAFLLYGFIGDRPADLVLSLMFGSPSPKSNSNADDDDRSSEVSTFDRD